MLVFLSLVFAADPAPLAVALDHGILLELPAEPKRLRNTHAQLHLLPTNDPTKWLAIGARPGTTTVRASFRDEPPIEYPITVAARGDHQGKYQMMARGGVLTLQAPADVRWIGVANPDVADAYVMERDLLGERTLVIRGVGDGETTVVVLLEGGGHILYDVDVRPFHRAEYALMGVQPHEAPLGASFALKADPPPIGFVMGDPDVVEVLYVEGKGWTGFARGLGHADVVGFAQGGAMQLWSFDVVTAAP